MIVVRGRRLHMKENTHEKTPEAIQLQGFSSTNECWSLVAHATAKVGHATAGGNRLA